jgi:hypothetical protein
LLVVLLGIVPLVGSPLAEASASADDQLVRVSRRSPFADCPAAGLDDLLPPGEVEPVVVADPADPESVVAAWTQDRFRGIVAGGSADGGRTWRRPVVPGLTRCTGGTFDYADDLAMSVGSDGVVHLSAHVFDADRQRSGLLATSSADGGRTWASPVTVVEDTLGGNGEYAGGAIAVDAADPRHVYGLVPFFGYPDGPGGEFRGTVAFARSEDGGATWSSAWQLPDMGDGWLSTGHQLSVLGDGTLVDVFTLLDLRQDPQRPRVYIAAIRSHDRGETWTEPTTIAETRSVGVRDPENSDLVASGTRYQPAVTVDRRAYRLFVAWQDPRFNDGQADAIALSWSDDGAGTWSEPVKVNATPTELRLEDQQAFSPSLAAADGAIGISYSDLRFNEEDGSLPTDRWLLECRLDGRGLSLPACVETRLTASSFDMRRAHLVTEVGPPGFYLGDYQGLTATSGGFIAAFAQPHRRDSASVFARAVSFDSPEGRSASARAARG